MVTLLGSRGALDAVKAIPSSETECSLLQQCLPIAQIPREKKLRKELFRRMDVNRNGYLTLTEVQAGLPPLLKRETPGDRSKLVVPVDLKPAIKCAFNAARHIAPDDRKTMGKLKKKKTAKLGKGHAKSDLVDVREFHALLVAFKHYLELNVMFSKIDNNDDRVLCWREVNKPQCLALLEEWNIAPEQAKDKFPDEWTPSLKFEEFAEWCIVRRFGSWDIPLELDENDPEETLKDAAGNTSAVTAIGKVLQAFRDWDQDGDGMISQEELARVMVKLDPKFTAAMAAKLFVAADVNQDGKVDYAEFLNWLTA